VDQTDNAKQILSGLATECVAGNITLENMYECRNEKKKQAGGKSRPRKWHQLTTTEINKKAKTEEILQQFPLRVLHQPTPYGGGVVSQLFLCG